MSLSAASSVINGVPLTLKATEVVSNVRDSSNSPCSSPDETLNLRRWPRSATSPTDKRPQSTAQSVNPMPPRTQFADGGYVHSCRTRSLPQRFVVSTRTHSKRNDALPSLRNMLTNFGSRMTAATGTCGRVTSAITRMPVQDVKMSAAHFVMKYKTILHQICVHLRASAVKECSG